jgi:Predicted transcriptional regulators
MNIAIDPNSISRTKKPNPDDVHVGSRLRACRILAGLSQQALGAHVNLSFQQIQKYEKGINRIGASRLQQFATILNVAPSYFFEGLQNGSRPVFPVTTPAQDPDISTIAPGVSNAIALELVRNYSAIKENKVRNALYQLVKSCAETDEDKSGNKRGRKKKPGSESGHNASSFHN